MKIVVDSPTLIYFNKTGLDWIFREFETFIPESVYKEVVSGSEKNRKDSAIAENLANQGSLKVLKAKSVFKNTSTAFNHLGLGEIEALCLAKENNCIAIIDDRSAREIGKLFGVEVHGSFYLLLVLCAKGKISKSQAVEFLNNLIDSGWYCSTEVYKAMLEKLKGI